MKHHILVFCALAAMIFAFGAFAAGSEAITLTEGGASVGVGEEMDLYSLIIDEDKADCRYTYKSKNEFVASVSDEGLIEGRRNGRTTIVITKHINPAPETTNEDGGETGEEENEYTVDTDFTITVDNAPSEVSLSAHNILLVVDQELTLEYSIIGGVSSSNTFESRNEMIVKVSEDGVITANGTGSTEVYLKAYNGKYDECRVTVIEEAPKLSLTDKNTKIQKGSNNHTIKYSFNADVDDKSVTFETSDANVLRINSSDRLTGMKTGSATVYLKTAYDNLSASRDYTVVDDALPLNANAAQTALDHSNVVRQKYGTSVKGRPLEGYIITNKKTGEYEKTLFMDFAVHGFEDSYAKDGQKLTEEANALIEYFAEHSGELGKYRLVIVPCANPDGTIAGKNNKRACATAYGRCTADHIDMNRDFNYFKAVESQYLRDFIKSSEVSVYLNMHGWLNETLGTKKLCGIINKQQGFTKHIMCYGTKSGYIIGWVHVKLKIPCALVEYKAPNKISRSRDIKMIKEIIKAYK